MSSPRILMLGITFWSFLTTAAFAQSAFWAIPYHDHKVLEEVKPFTYSYISKGRVQIVTLREGLSIKDIPSHLRSALQPIDPAIMSTTPVSDSWLRLQQKFGLKQADSFIDSVISQASVDAYKEKVERIVSFGRRTSNASIDYFMEELTSYGYRPVHDYNVEALKVGTTKPDELVIIVGHMDTVANTVGADDNASGAAAVLEAARILAPIETERSILFLITEDEERGLLGAKRKVSDLSTEGRLGDVKFVVNMDMIAYNRNGILDLETKPAFEGLADWMAEQTMIYTNLRPNKVLQPWGSDHVPFLDANVPTLLTIEHWNTHTPCWHQSCDTLDTLNYDYAIQIVRLNIAALMLKGLAVVTPP